MLFKITYRISEILKKSVLNKSERALVLLSFCYSKSLIEGFWEILSILDKREQKYETEKNWGKKEILTILNKREQAPGLGPWYEKSGWGWGGKRNWKKNRRKETLGQKRAGPGFGPC